MILIQCRREACENAQRCKVSVNISKVSCESMEGEFDEQITALNPMPSWTSPPRLGSSSYFATKLVRGAAASYAMRQNGHTLCQNGRLWSRHVNISSDHSLMRSVLHVVHVGASSGPGRFGDISSWSPAKGLDSLSLTFRMFPSLMSPTFI